MISARAIRNSPDLQKKMNIEKNDERNILLANTAKGKAFDMMTYVFGALMVSFALMEVDWTAILLLVFAYIYVLLIFSLFLSLLRLGNSFAWEKMKTGYSRFPQAGIL